MNTASSVVVGYVSVVVIVSLVFGAPWSYLTGALTATAGTWSVRRAFRIRLVVTQHLVTIDNYWKSHSVAWSDIDGVGIAVKGVLPRPALAFRRRAARPVFAQATPLRQSERRKLQAAVLALAPRSVQPLRDAAGIIGSDRAPTNLIRLWWKKHRASNAPFPLLLLPAAGLAVTGLGLGIAVFVGALREHEGSFAYVVAFLLSAGGTLACIGSAVLFQRFLRSRRSIDVGTGYAESQALADSEIRPMGQSSK
jgi:hypothetical protein